MFDDSISGVFGFDVETVNHPSYRFENDGRGERRLAVIQRTNAGRNWFMEKGRRYDVPAGYAMLFTHDEPTAYGYPEDGTEECSFTFLNIDVGGHASMFAQLRADFGSVVRMPDKSEPMMLFEEAIERFSSHTFQDRLHSSELIYRLLVALYREQVQDSRVTDPIEFGFHCLRSHFRTPINLKQVAEKCGVSREHFIREFTRRYHESPGGLLRRLRLENARVMLSIAESDMETIALANGYTSANTFCRAYRTRFGTSPAKDSSRRRR
jgi:AraC-like DNA-binding protein